MNLFHARMLVLGGVAIGTAVYAFSQGPLAKTAQTASHPKPTNLKVLPKDLSGDDVDKLMHRYKEELGVPCAYCHVENTETKQIDFISDENPIKQTARVMIGMTGDINAKYLAQLGDRRYAEPLTCGNCHQGQTSPPTFEPKPDKN